MEKSSENSNVNGDKSRENLSKINLKFIFLTKNFANYSHKMIIKKYANIVKTKFFFKI